MPQLHFRLRKPIRGSERIVPWIVIPVGLLCIAVGIFAFFEAQTIRQEDRLLAERGRRVQGIVIDRRQDVDADDDRDYYLLVRYPPGVEREFRVPYAPYAFTARNGLVDVLVDPEDPKLARLAGSLRTGTPLETTFAGILFLVVGVGAIGFVIWQMRHPEEADVPSLDEAIEAAKNR